ncbi:putative leucine-rich repeat receptor-like protein kinase [Dorcoceras hygrometricum]|uniref:Putative leucine-rich repeat receptor-like protein kinase n=1 Tax=Dorcoceras hygrometricum TaxID=472368 RepID=A0A2Z7B353_9LAMI|nr:putative leucine-rich repeat receptor-like protein kinase [Dorcoceras hygrometricum]
MHRFQEKPTQPHGPHTISHGQTLKFMAGNSYAQTSLQPYPNNLKGSLIQGWEQDFKVKSKSYPQLRNARMRTATSCFRSRKLQPPKWVRDERAFQEEFNATSNVKNGGRINGNRQIKSTVNSTRGFEINRERRSHKLHDTEKPLNEKSGLGFSYGKSSSEETCTQSDLACDKFKKMNFSKAIVMHDVCELVKYDDQFTGQL